MNARDYITDKVKNYLRTAQALFENEYSEATFIDFSIENLIRCKFAVTYDNKLLYLLKIDEKTIYVVSYEKERSKVTYSLEQYYLNGCKSLHTTRGINYISPDFDFTDIEYVFETKIFQNKKHLELI